MKILMTIFVVLLTIFAGLAIYLGQFGLFASVNIAEQNKGNYWLVYKSAKGDYQQTAALTALVQESLEQDYQIESKRCFGLYYDNPQDVAASELRSIVGCMVKTRAEAQQVALSDQWRVAEFPASPSVATQFPWRGQQSIMIGIFKVYPPLTTYIAKHDIEMRPIMEIYDQQQKQIEYLMSTTLKQDFYQKLFDQ